MRRGKMVEAGWEDVADKIWKTFRDNRVVDSLVNKVKTYLKTRNDRDDLSPSEAAQIYRGDDYGDKLPLSGKRNLDIDWSAHAEYRSDLRDVPSDKVNNGILEWLRERLTTKGPDAKKVKMSLPGIGTAVVDYDLTRKPADAKVVTVWASDRTADDRNEPPVKHRMPTDKNLGTRVERDQKKFHKTKRQKDKQDLRKYYSMEAASGSLRMAGGEDLARGLVGKGLPLSQAIIVASTACEKCMNVLADECGLDWGYAVGSEEWKRCGTSCGLCTRRNT